MLCFLLIFVRKQQPYAVGGRGCGREGKRTVRGGEAMAAKRTTAQGGFAQRNAAPAFARQTQKVGPMTGQPGFAAGEMEAEADKCPQHAAGREDGGRGAAL